MHHEVNGHPESLQFILVDLRVHGDGEGDAVVESHEQRCRARQNAAVQPAQMQTKLHFFNIFQNKKYSESGPQQYLATEKILLT
jgi:hypothetical protein